MNTPAGGPSDRRIQLQYNGRCRVCGKSLSPGSLAIYEPSGHSVRCVACEALNASMDFPIEQGHVPLAERPARTDDLRLRAPASAVIAETLRVQERVAPRSPAARLFGVSPLNAESRPWYLGALGELEVARLLDGLRPEWHAVHAIPVSDSGSDIDHVLVGPGGVYTINSKFHEGTRVWVGRRRLLVNGQRTDHLRNAAFEGRRASKLLTASVGQRVKVLPIIAIVAARSITIHERPIDVVVLPAPDLVRWLQRRPVALSEGEVQQIYQAASSSSTWGDFPMAAADLAGFSALRSDVTAAR